MLRTFGIAGVQMEVLAGEGNIANIEKRLIQIHQETPWVELVLFSELCVFGNHPKYAEPVPGKTTDILCSLAQQYGLWLVPGSINEQTENGIFNTAVVINPKGEIVTRYQKMYPWRPAEKCVSGDKFCVFDIPGRARIGLCICYDQWFPEVARQLTWMGAEVILCPTMTSTPDRPQELIVSQANAIANQLYFVNINGLGHGGNGQSIIVDPEGNIIAQESDQEGILTVKMDLDKVADVRENGTMGASQVLKSFRDGDVSFPVYSQGIMTGEGFKGLGSIEKKKN
jgi:deaminated glutathione amidase